MKQGVLLYLASASAIKLEAAKAVFGEGVVSVGAADTTTPQPVTKEFGIMFACSRLDAIKESPALSIESFIEKDPNAGWVDRVAVVYRFQNGIKICHVGTSIMLHPICDKLLEDVPKVFGGFSITAGQLMKAAGYAKTADNWQLDVANISRVKQIKGVLDTLQSQMGCDDLIADDLLANLRYIPNHPKPGVLFKDMNPLMSNETLLHPFVKCCVKSIAHRDFTLVVGLEARGLALGALLARTFFAGFVMARKAGKLPPPVVQRKYGTEYSQDVLEMDAHQRLDGKRVLIVDDLIATGGSMLAVVEMVRELGGDVVECFAPFCVEPIWEETKAKFLKQGVMVRVVD